MTAQQRQAERYEVLQSLAGGLSGKVETEIGLQLRRLFATGALTWKEVVLVWKEVRERRGEPLRGWR